MSGLKIGVIGATGMVGRQYLEILEHSPLAVDDLRLYASARSVGSRMTFAGDSLAVQELTVEACRGLDVALFSVSTELARQYAPQVAANGTLVIDDSSAFRLDPDVPLVVPEVNPEATRAHKGIIAGPNCSTAQMVVALQPLHKAAGITRVIVDTYQAASGAGKAAMDELIDHSRRVLDGEHPAPENHPQSLPFNVFPHIDSFMDDGYTKEEWKMQAESGRSWVCRTCASLPPACGCRWR